MAGFPLILIDSFVILILPITILDILLAIGAFAMICNMYSCELSVRKLSRRWKENEELAQRNLDEIRKMLKEYQY